MALSAAFRDRYQHRESALHGADARVKLPTALAYILAITLTSPGDWGVLAFLAVPIALGILISSLSPIAVLGRSLLALPFVLAAVPLAFTQPGEAVLTIPVLGWDASRDGLVAVGSILLESWLAVLVGVLLTSTTPASELLRGLRALRLPRLLVATVFFTYRYLHVVGDEGVRMMRARDSRSAELPGRRSGGTVRWRASVAGHMVGSLFSRSVDRGERVYAAMQARGYDGEPRFLENPPLRLGQIAVGAAVVLAAAMVHVAGQL